MSVSLNWGNILKYTTHMYRCFFPSDICIHSHVIYLFVMLITSLYTEKDVLILTNDNQSYNFCLTSSHISV
jgi:hypothetical protein